MITLDAFLPSLKDTPLANTDGRWVPARPLRFHSLRYRARDAWLAMTGRADAPVRPQDYRTAGVEPGRRMKTWRADTGQAGDRA